MYQERREDNSMEYNPMKLLWKRKIYYATNFSLQFFYIFYLLTVWIVLWNVIYRYVPYVYFNLVLNSIPYYSSLIVKVH